MVKQIKLFLTDVDGTLTDGGLYYTVDGKTMKKYNCKDGQGIANLKAAGVIVGFITGSNCGSVNFRAEKLKVDYVFKNVEGQGKLDVALDIVNSIGITMEEVAYIGDDQNDIELLSAVGISACPANGTGGIHTILNSQGKRKVIRMTKPGGEGAVREFIDFLKTKGYV